MRWYAYVATIILPATPSSARPVHIALSQIRHICVRATAHAVSLRHLCGPAAPLPTPARLQKNAYGVPTPRAAETKRENKIKKRKKEEQARKAESRTTGRSPPSVCPSCSAATDSDPQTPSERPSGPPQTEVSAVRRPLPARSKP
jgi:hypothetical protein